jgi:LPS O-antigen subunit length determinant protein (WzzB/FepE family)
LDPVKVPLTKTGPKRSLFILGAFLTGLIFSAIWVLVSMPIKEFLKVFKTLD